MLPMEMGKDYLKPRLQNDHASPWNVVQPFQLFHILILNQQPIVCVP